MGRGDPARVAVTLDQPVRRQAMRVGQALRDRLHVRARRGDRHLESARNGDDREPVEADQIGDLSLARRETTKRHRQRTSSIVLRSLTHWSEIKDGQRVS